VIGESECLASRMSGTLWPTLRFGCLNCDRLEQVRALASQKFLQSVVVVEPTRDVGQDLVPGTELFPGAKADVAELAGRLEQFAQRDVQGSGDGLEVRNPRLRFSQLDAAIGAAREASGFGYLYLGKALRPADP